MLSPWLLLVCQKDKMVPLRKKQKESSTLDIASIACLISSAECDVLDTSELKYLRKDG